MVVKAVVILLFCLLRGTLQSSTPLSEDLGKSNQGKGLNQYYFGYFVDATPLLYISSEQDVPYSIEAPGVGHSKNGTTNSGNPNVIIPRDVIVSSINDQNKGIHLTTDHDVSNVFGFSYESPKSCTFRLIPHARLTSQEYIYYSISPRSPSTNSQYNSSILIVGTENDTEMELTVTQQVQVNINGTVTLLPNTQYSFVINRLQTVYISSPNDLTGSKIVTENPVSVFSGHEQEFNVSYMQCSIEQIPPTALWDRVHYVTPIANNHPYTISVLATDDSTDIDIYCNDVQESHIIDEGESVMKILGPKDNCAIFSDKEVLVTQFGNGNDGLATMMIVMPGVTHYSNELKFSHSNTVEHSARHVNLIVLAEYYQPDSIRLIGGGTNKTLSDGDWTPIKVNSVNVAYALHYPFNTLLGETTIVHTNPDALMMVTAYSFSTSQFGHGHSAGFNVRKFLATQCPQLDAPDNGEISCVLGDDGVPTEGDTCSFTCDDDFVLIGSNTRTCQNDFTWTGTEAMCTRESCPSLTSPDNGMIQCSGFFVDDICVFTCDDGYELSGSDTRTCQDDGTWTGTEAECTEERLCPSLPAPDDGMIQCSGTSVGDICAFTCDKDFELSGSCSRTCQDDLTWSGTETMCSRAVCPMLGDPDNGEVRCSSGDDGILTEGDTCIYVCDEGFTVSGDSIVRECQSDGTWSGSAPTCERLLCAPLEAPDNGDIQCTGSLFEDTCSFTCDDGFELSGSPTRTCQSDANWSGTEAVCVQACAIQSVKTRVNVIGRNAVVTFSAVPDHHEAMYRCKLNNGRYKPCTSPMTYSNLHVRSHRITVQAVCPGRSAVRRKRFRFRVGNGGN